MTPEVQKLHFLKYNHWWSVNSKRMKRSMRSRLRWNDEQWNRNVDQCALAIYVIDEAKKDKRVTEDMINNMQRAFVNGFLPENLISILFQVFSSCFSVYNSLFAAFL